MRVEQYTTNPHLGAAATLGGDASAQLVLVFGPSRRARHGPPSAAWFADLATRYPAATRVYCSTAGHVADTDVYTGGVCVTAVAFAHGAVRAVARVAPEGAVRADAEALGRALVGALPAAVPEGPLRHVVVFVDGTRVAAGGLVAGMTAVLPAGVRMTGGLAGDDDRVEETVVGLDGPPAPGTVVAVGLYGAGLEVGAGACGGWTLFGPDRVVTRAEGNVLYELDGEPALALYKRYLGPYAAELPRSGLLFPLALRTPEGDTGVVRTVFGVDEATQSLRFAGDVPVGVLARLMKSSAERLIDGAGAAAELAADLVSNADEPGASATDGGPALALLVSCSGRRWVLGQRTEEELQAVRAALGSGATLAGFYGYGEIAPLGRGGAEVLHNQTMTVTLVRERAVGERPAAA